MLLSHVIRIGIKSKCSSSNGIYKNNSNGIIVIIVVEKKPNFQRKISFLFTNTPIAVWIYLILVLPPIYVGNVIVGEDNLSQYSYIECNKILFSLLLRYYYISFFNRVNW